MVLNLYYFTPNYTHNRRIGAIELFFQRCKNYTRRFFSQRSHAIIHSSYKTYLRVKPMKYSKSTFIFPQITAVLATTSSCFISIFLDTDFAFFVDTKLRKPEYKKQPPILLAQGNGVKFYNSSWVGISQKKKKKKIHADMNFHLP